MGMKKWIVITGDIIESRKNAPESWLERLKEVLSDFGQEKTNWEIYRGDSFQLILSKKESMEAVLLLKSAMKSIGVDVRMAIGLGEIDYKSPKVSESNGSAFVNSGRKLESLKKETLGIQTPNEKFNQRYNVILNLLDFIIDSWQPTTAEVVFTALKNPQMNQSELAKLLQKKSQGTISSALKRAGFDEIRKVVELYNQEIKGI